MYRKHFALTRHPFDTCIAPELLFAADAQKELEVRLAHLIDLRGMGLLTGEPGSGKTIIARKIACALHPGLFRVLYVPNSSGNVMDLYKSIGWELGIPTEKSRSRAALYNAIRQEVSRLCQEAKIRPLLIID